MQNLCLLVDSDELSSNHMGWLLYLFCSQVQVLTRTQALKCIADSLPGAHHHLGQHRRTTFAVLTHTSLGLDHSHQL